MQITCYSDGSAHPEGDNWIGSGSYWIVHSGGRIIRRKEYGLWATNNISEYRALLDCAREVFELAGTIRGDYFNVAFNIDSQLVANQVNGTYKVLDLKLRSCHLDVINAIKQIESLPLCDGVHVNWIPRERNLAHVG